MENKKIVIGIGELLWDVLPTGKKAGGAPVNFAFHASQSGAQGYAISAVGRDDLGDELLQQLDQNKIKYLVERVDRPTGTVQVTLDCGIPQYVICEDVAWDFIPLTDQMKQLALSADAISFGTLAQRNSVSRETTQQLLMLAPPEAIKMYDINLRQHFYSKEIIEKSLELANCLKINDEELVVLKELYSLDMEGDQLCGWFVKQYNLKLLILTAGEHYSIVFTPDQQSRIETPKVTVADTVGAGDCFSGVLIGELLQGTSLKEAHSKAVAAAAYVCTQHGAWITHKK